MCSDSKASAYVGDPGWIPGSEIYSGEGNGNSLKYSCLENPMGGGAWHATVHGVAKSQTRLSNFTFKGAQWWLFIEGTDAEAETPILWPPDAES